LEKSAMELKQNNFIDCVDLLIRDIEAREGMMSCHEDGWTYNLSNIRWEDVITGYILTGSRA
jgi:hypothetical protein